MIRRWSAKLLNLSIHRPWSVLIAMCCLTLLTVPGLFRLEVRTDGHALVPKKDPVVQVDREVREIFGIRDPIVILIETAHPEGIYNVATLDSVRKISDAVLELPGIESHDVTSLATERRDRVFPGTLKFRQYLNPFPDTPRLMDVLREDIDAAEILDGTLVSEDGTAVTVMVGVPEGAAGGFRDRQELLRRLRELVAPFETEQDRISVVGAPVAEALLGAHIFEDLELLLPLAFLVIAVVIWLGCGRVWGVALALFEVGAALVFTFGLMGWLDFPIYLSTAVLPVILTTIGLADEIHIFWHYQQILDGDDDESLRPLERAMADMSRPVILSSVTTSLAFLSFLSSPIAPVWSFGLFAAVGTLFCMVWSLTVVPACLALLPPSRMRRPARSWGVFGKGTLVPPVAFLMRHRRLAFGALALVTVALGWQVRALFIQDSWVQGFRPDSEFRRETHRANQLLHGTHVLLARLSFDAPEEMIPQVFSRRGPLLSPEILEAIGGLEEHIRAQPTVGGVLGTYSHLSTVSYLWLGRKEGTRRVPDEPRRVDLIINRFDRGRGEHRRREVVADDLEQTLVTIFLEDANYRDTQRLMDSVRDYVEEHLSPYGARLDFAGDVAVSQAMIPAVVRTQVLSLLLALGGALIVLCVLFRSIRLGLLAVAPTCVAVLWIFGLMGWLEIPLGVATSMFCAITLGIGVDYAIHYVERWRANRRQGHADAALRSVREAGPAILVDALAIALGFGLLASSQVPANARLGILVAGALAVSAVLTLVGLSLVVSRKRTVDAPVPRPLEVEA